MGILKAGASAVRGAAADQWKEYFVCNGMSADDLMVQAKRVSSELGANQGASGVITDGSLIVVGEGECAVATDGGKILGIYDTQGEHIYHSESSRGIFGGGLGSVAKDIGRRISFGGVVPSLQRVYYINTKEIPNMGFSVEGAPLRVKDERIGLDFDGTVQCGGAYSFRIADPEKYYKLAASSSMNRSARHITQQMNSELLTVIGPILCELVKEGIRPSELPAHTETVCEKLTSALSEKWNDLRGIEVFSLGISSILVLEREMVRDLQRDAVFRDPTMAAAHLTGARGDAMQTAAENTSGGSWLAAAIMAKPQSETDEPKTEMWICSCGAESQGKFCPEFGNAKPETWLCACGAKSKGKFCPECGTPKP